MSVLTTQTQKIERQRDRETERQRDRETERQRDRETERQRDRETERQTGNNTIKGNFEFGHYASFRSNTNSISNN